MTLSMSERDDGIERAFWSFHAEHPEVYDAIVELARRWRGSGRARWSVEGAFAVLRWERHMRGLPAAGERFKLNDHYTSRYARLVMEREPDLEGIFQVRELRG